MTRESRHSVLAFCFRSEFSGDEDECFFCGATFPVLPVIVEISAHYDGSSGGFSVCPACVLSDPKSIAAKTRRTAAEHYKRVKGIKRKRKCDRTEEDLEFLEFGNDSDDLVEYAIKLDTLEDVSSILNHELAIAIAKQYLRKADGNGLSITSNGTSE